MLTSVCLPSLAKTCHEPWLTSCLIGTGTFQACWVSYYNFVYGADAYVHVLTVDQVLTAIVGVALLFRYAIKVWVRCALPQVTAPGRVWGIEDLFFLVAYGCDIAHMAFIQLR